MIFLGIINGYGQLVLLIVGVFVVIGLVHNVLFSKTAVAARQKRRFQRYLSSLQSSQIFDGHLFEQFIAQKLRDHGMVTEVTRGSGDQGVDVLATTRRGTRIAIQTKLHSKSVGNKAVQEVFAGMQYYRCSAAIVITNNSFTTSAISLAAVTGVKLVDCMQLGELEKGTHWIYDS